MDLYDDPYATSTTDLQDLAALDRLAGQLAPQAALRRYGHQHAARGVGAPTSGGWHRLRAAVKQFYAEQKHLHELHQNRHDVSGRDALAAVEALRSSGNGLLEIGPLDAAATHPEDREAA